VRSVRHCATDAAGYAKAESRDDERKRTLKVIAKIPKCDRQRFQTPLEEDSAEKEDRASRDLREIVLGGLEGMAACRDVPDSVVKAARKRFFMSQRERKEFADKAATGKWNPHSGSTGESTTSITQGAHSKARSFSSSGTILPWAPASLSSS
jgi:hypothetical protein